MEPAHNSAEQLPAMQQPALLPNVVPPTQNRNLATRCSHPYFLRTNNEFLEGASPPVFYFLCVLILLITILIPKLIDFSVTAAYGNIPAMCLLFVAAIILFGCAAALQQERRRRDQTYSRTGYVPPNVRQRTQERQGVPTSEDEADQETSNIAGEP
jgi:hypothetical protein